MSDRGLADTSIFIARSIDNVFRTIGEAIVLVGRGRDRELVVELWQWLVRRIEWLSATHGAGATGGDRVGTGEKGSLKNKEAMDAADRKAFAKMKSEIERVARTEGLSKNLFEIATRALG